MNCNGCIANTIAQTGMQSNNVAHVAQKAIETCRELRAAGVCDLEPTALLLDMRRPVAVEVRQ